MKNLTFSVGWHCNWQGGKSKIRKGAKPLTLHEILTYNLALALALLAWTAAQVIKVIINLISERTLDLKLLISSGGMPSSHSAIVCACAASVGYLYGCNSGAFAVAVITALVVMYDAANVRHAAGEQAKVLNYIMEHWNQIRPELFATQLKELLGHTPIQVFFGALLGVAVGWGGCYLWA